MRENNQVQPWANRQISVLLDAVNEMDDKNPREKEVEQIRKWKISKQSKDDIIVLKQWSIYCVPVIRFS